ncbi:aldose epimerase [Pantanalinema sp. GBBB05]|uniref:aldose epimerase family protein n=1 Tax=Pantanalinema sp. GBBB05 TaxID=2604139 RepID=UPI001D1F385A|nr:aldose epimerase [Pantanalinema sp. GBBB05]
MAITVEQRQYLTYILEDEAVNALLEVVPERGGIITRWQVQGQELLYLDAERFANPELTVRGGIPILFPICGNLPDHTYSYQGQTYTLKQHGFARDLPWEVLEQTATDRLSLTLGLSSNLQTWAVYPFDFHLAFTYVLQANTLTLHQRYTNQSAEAMPFAIGFHPYFGVEDKSALQFQIPATEWLDQRTKATQPYSGAFDWSADEIDVAFTELSSQVATVTDTQRSRRLTLHSSPAFSTLVFWTVKGKDFYCLEPWTAPRNALNTGERLLYLAPGASLETSVTCTIELI